MVPLTMLWLPILVSAVIVFIAASLAWMVLPHHRKDYRKVATEDVVMEALRAGDVGPGQYMFPHPGDAKGRTPEWKAKVEKGPAGSIVIYGPGLMNMAPKMIQYFIWVLIIETLVAYVTGRALTTGADYLEVFRIAGTTAILGFAGASAPFSIWFGRPWSITAKEMIDGIVFGLLTAGVFGWLWPGIDI